ncbi:MAG TPA: DUF1579 family protein [Planctomycetota bacterium]|nr:DUF1579 family protein [Planctomycetota bacterium]
MIRPVLALAATAAFFPTLHAQDDHRAQPPGGTGATAQAQPNPRTEEHDALRSFVGTWEVTCKMTTADGQTMEAKGIERAELMCNGLWLKATGEGTWGDTPYRMLWLLGYDPHGKSFRGVCVDNHEPSPVENEGHYDADSKTFTFRGTGQQGPFEVTSVVKDADTIVETGTCRMDGKECKMEITRKRTSGKAPAEASAAKGDGDGEERAELARLVGTWEATMKVAPTPGAPVQEMKGSEVVVPVCAGRYVWTTFSMDWQGRPFEGHALFGYDEQQKKFVSYWIDSMSPSLSKSTGSLDASGKVLTMHGSSRDAAGKPVSTTETHTWKGEGERHMKMEMRGEQAESFEITYARKDDAARSSGKGAEDGK